MDLHVHLEGRSDLAREIHRQIRSAIVSGKLKSGSRLPPTRELARRLDVSRNTVSLAYEWLVAEGIASGRAGAGTFVERVAVSPPLPRRSRGSSIRVRDVWQSIKAPTLPVAARYDFGVGMPDARLFPSDVWRRLVVRHLKASTIDGAYGHPAGLPRLRDSIARHVGASRGVRALPDDVIVTAGAQQAFDLVARLLIEPGNVVAIEEPGYPPVRMLFESAGARVVPVRVDGEGLVVDELPDHARIVYVTPSHQFPMGMPMSHARRAALLAWAGRRNAVIVEDDYDSEFRFGGRPLETLQAMDRGGRVIYVGSFSKTMLPSLRLGFVIAPAELTGALTAAAFVSGWFPPAATQAALAKFIDDGLLARHVRKMRREYATRHDTILGILESAFGDWLEPVPSTTGMHLAALLKRKSVRHEREIAASARRAGVAFDLLSSYCARKPIAGMVLGYGGIATSDVSPALTRLRRCFE